MSAENCDKQQELVIEEQKDEEDTSTIASNRKIFTDKGDPEVDSLYRKWKKGKLVLQPEFQRHFVWDDKKASRLIESALLDIPLPMIYISEDVDDKEYIIDGQQRLTSFFSFIDGKFPPTSEHPNGKDFKLGELKVYNELKGKSFKEIGDKLQDKINNFHIRTITFKKESDPLLRYEIFERLNTGAVALNDQELRNCVFRGNYNTLLKELSQDVDYRYLLGLPCEEKRMRDVEYVLRFASFYHATYLKYNAPMRKFLDKDMETYKNISEKDEAELRTAFKNTVIILRSLLDKHAFKRFYAGNERNKNGRWEEKKFNASLYDIMMYIFSKADKNKVYQNLDSIREALIDLMTTDPEFIDSIDKSTSSVQAVTKRFDKWRHTVEGIIGINEKEPRCFTNQLKKELFDNNRTCAICGQEIKNIDDSAVDHIKQYWTGGQTIPENARLAHRYCNWSRPRNDVASTTQVSGMVTNADKSNEEEKTEQAPKIKVTWEEKLATKDEHVKNLLKVTMSRMSNEFKDASFKTTDSLRYAKGEDSPSNRFVVFMLREHGIKFRVRINPATVIDPQQWVGGRSYRWFFYDGNGEEREFMVTSEDQLEYAMNLIKQSYSLIP